MEERAMWTMNLSIPDARGSLSDHLFQHIEMRVCNFKEVVVKTFGSRWSFPLLLVLLYFWQKHTHNVSQWVATNRQLLLQADLCSMESLNSSPTAAALESLTGKCKQCSHDNVAAQQTLTLSSCEVKGKRKEKKCGCPFAPALRVSRWRRSVQVHPDHIVKYVWGSWIRYSLWK